MNDNDTAGFEYRKAEIAAEFGAAFKEIRQEAVAPWMDPYDPTNTFNADAGLLDALISGDYPPEEALDMAGRLLDLSNHVKAEYGNGWWLPLYKAAVRLQQLSGGARHG